MFYASVAIYMLYVTIITTIFETLIIFARQLQKKPQLKSNIAEVAMTAHKSQVYIIICVAYQTQLFKTVSTVI
jgi:hypothetical protein